MLRERLATPDETWMPLKFFEERHAECTNHGECMSPKDRFENIAMGWVTLHINKILGEPPTKKSFDHVWVFENGDTIGLLSFTNTWSQWKVPLPAELLKISQFLYNEERSALWYVDALQPLWYSMIA